MKRPQNTEGALRIYMRFFWFFMKQPFAERRRITPSPLALREPFLGGCVVEERVEGMYGIGESIKGTLEMREHRGLPFTASSQPFGYSFNRSFRNLCESTPPGTTSLGSCMTRGATTLGFVNISSRPLSYSLTLLSSYPKSLSKQFAVDALLAAHLRDLFTSWRRRSADM